MRRTLDLVNKKGASADDDVMELLHGVVHALKARHHQHAPKELEDAGLTPMDGRVLHFFARHPGHTQSDLALHSGRDRGQLARLIQGLRERGLLQAEPDAADRRVIRLTLTEAGRDAHQRLHRHRRRVASRAIDGFSAEELATLAALLRRMRANLEGGEGAPG